MKHYYYLVLAVAGCLCFACNSHKEHVDPGLDESGIWSIGYIGKSSEDIPLPPYMKGKFTGGNNKGVYRALPYRFYPLTHVNESPCELTMIFGKDADGASYGEIDIMSKSQDISLDGQYHYFHPKFWGNPWNFVFSTPAADSVVFSSVEADSEYPYHVLVSGSQVDSLISILKRGTDLKVEGLFDYDEEAFSHVTIEIPADSLAGFNDVHKALIYHKGIYDKYVTDQARKEAKKKK